MKEKTPKDPLKRLLIKKPRKKFLQTAFVALLKLEGKWTIASIHTSLGQAEFEIEQFKKLSPAEIYKTAACTIFIGQHYLK